MKFLLTLLVISGLFFSSCGGSDEASSSYVPLKQVIDTQNPSTSNSNTNAPSFVADTSVHLTPGTTNPQTVQSIPSNNQVITTVPVTTKTPAGMNPPHGEPGHRCDIAVGAPLNSKPVVQPQAVTTKSVTPAGMNPPHGELGHRCDIPVGSPLNSPVVSNAPLKKDSGVIQQVKAVEKDSTIKQ